jgi:AmmeMemoRadiSam system protein B
MNETVPFQSEFRRPVAAGTFYPTNPVELAKQVASFFAEVEKHPLPSRPTALVVPHSAYPYCGKIAARAFKLLEGEQYDTVVIVAPAHAVFFEGASVYTGKGYATPLGTIETDLPLAEKIASMNPKVYASAMGHATGSTRGEHSLEVLLPFLQIVLGNFKLVAIMMGEQDESTSRALGDILAATTGHTNTLLIASTDLSHFHTEQQARKLDATIRHAVEAYDPQTLLQSLDSGTGEACGGGGLAAIMLASRRLGATSIAMLDYATSGQTTGDFDDVVGYMSAAIVSQVVEKHKIVLGSPRRDRTKVPEDLTADDRSFLRAQATLAIEARFAGTEYTPENRDPLASAMGVFVTVSIDGHPREPYGRLRPEMPLFESVPTLAVGAIFDDPRYAAVSPEEFTHAQIDITIISSLARIAKISEFTVGSSGLLIRLDMHSALFLPAEITRRKWSASEALEQISLKAGLPRQGYLDKQAELYRFTVVSI